MHVAKRQEAVLSIDERSVGISLIERFQASGSRAKRVQVLLSIIEPCSASVHVAKRQEAVLRKASTSVAKPH